MSRLRHETAVFAIPAVCVAMVVVTAGVVLGDAAARNAVVGGDGLGGAVVALSFSVVGALLASRRPRHPIGWLFCVGGVAGAVTAVGTALAALGSPAAPQRWAAWAASMVPGVGMAATIGTLLVLPDGRLPSPRWQPLAWLTGVATAVLVVGEAFSPELSGGGGGLANPVGMEAFRSEWVFQGGVGWLLLTPAFLGAGLSVVVRYRRGSLELRHQLKWVLAAGVLVGLGAVATTATYGGSRLLFGVAVTLMVLGVAAVPVAVAVAVLYHRLFDIDRLIRRSLVFGTISAAVALAYVAVAAMPGVLVGDRLPVGFAVAVTVVATLTFQPLRRWVDRWVGRLVYGERPSSYQVLTAFGALLEQTFDLTELAPRVADTVRTGLCLGWARVRLLPGPHGGGDAGADTAGLDAAPEPPALVVPLVHRGETVGVIECGPKQDGEFTGSDRVLLETIARQAALGIRNARLAADLSRRLAQIHHQAEALAASRARIVTAQDVERRRLERDIHDGVQQDIVSLLMNVRLARNQLRRDAGRADELLAGLQADVARILDELRELAHGIHPPVLTDRGLLEAVEARASRLPVGLRIEAKPSLRGARYPPEVEAAAYFVVSEALTNAIKHSACTGIVLRIACDDHRLIVEVEDDGVGMADPGSQGFGLAGLTDRVEALGGTLRLDSQPLAGTRVRAELPIAVECVP